MASLDEAFKLQFTDKVQYNNLHRTFENPNDDIFNLRTYTLNESEPIILKKIF